MAETIKNLDLQGTTSPRQVSRKEFLKQLSIASTLLFVACSPVRILLKAYPQKFDDDVELCERILRSFVTTIVPGAPIDDPNLMRIFTDDYYPFHKYCAFFVADLCKRSEDLFEETDFSVLSLAQRSQVVANGLASDATVSRLYRGAILMAQVSFYAGIYDDEKGCPLIDFHGSNFGFTPEEMYYPNNASLLSQAATDNGNYA